MAEFLNNIVGQLPDANPLNPNGVLNRIPTAPNLNIPQLPEIENPLSALQDKNPAKELADKAAAKYKELQDRLKNLKRPKNSIKKPKPLKLKEIPKPKKFKKAELEKFKGLSEFQNIKERTQKVTSNAKSVVSKAKGLTSNVEGLTSEVTNIKNKVTGEIEKGQNLLSQVKNFKSNIG